MGKITKDETEQKIKDKHSNKIKLLEFNGFSERGKFECLVCGNIWSAITRDIATENGCRNCYLQNHTLTHAFVKSEIEKNNCKLLSDYKNSSLKLKIMFSCGHIGNMNWSNFKNGQRCRVCAIEKRRHDIELKDFDIIDFLKKNGFEFVSFPHGFINRKESFVEYRCSLNHITTRKISSLYINPKCRQCSKENMIEIHTGSNSVFWKGGTSPIRDYAMYKILAWKKESIANSEYKCVITGRKFHEVHHLYSFGKIIFEALENTGLKINNNISEYSDNELSLFTNEVIRLHKYYPLGVCLERKIHILFHRLYGKGNNTPEQFYDFKKKIENKEIIINGGEND
jgi:hypothetical protein